MKYIRILLLTLCFMPCFARAASNEFIAAAQLLAAAKNADIQQVQSLINNGANVNFVDSTGLSIVCTALMNNDVRAAQILQMYGADASQCDRQIKQYNNKNKPKSTGGLFSGLSSAQNLTLAAAGAAVVVGGLLLLTDVFDPGNGNDDGVSSGNRPGQGENGGTIGGAGTTAFTLPYGPAMPNAESEKVNYADNLNVYSASSSNTGYKEAFRTMTNTYGQNYLLMMHGYSPLARGYLGMQTLRNTLSKEPIRLADNAVGADRVLGGMPVNVALVTANGINATADSSLADTLLPWTTLNVNGTAVTGGSNSMISSKYYNNNIVRGDNDNSLSDDSVKEVEKVAFYAFDLSNSGTAINNSNASDMDNLVAKVVGGRISENATTGDFLGFIPNGQMTIFRTGNGMGFIELPDAVDSGTYVRAGDTFATNDTLNLFGTDLTLTVTGNTFTATNGVSNYRGYFGVNGLIYIDSNADGNVNQAYAADGGKLLLQKTIGTIDYANYKALYNAMMLGGDTEIGRSRPSVLANASIIAPLHLTTAPDIDSVLNQDDYRVAIYNFVNNAYGRVEIDGSNSSGYYADAFFSQVGLGTLAPMVVFSTGAVETDSSYSDRVYKATFENAAPLAYNKLEHLFMSIVAVGLEGGTTGATSISDYSPTRKYKLSQWPDVGNSSTDTANNKYYKARVCDVAGTGFGSIDPWCFAAAGATDELAVSSAAGAVGAVQSAFSYLDNRQLFALLALTADGPYLATSDSGTAYTPETLASHLQSMYILPNRYNLRWQQGGEDYLDVFKEVFGYGLINLERATKPGTSVYYYDGNKIVSASGNAYWRAASGTVFRASGVLNPRVATLNAPFFDVLESTDGSLRLPRVWENQVDLGTHSRSALYMGDVLGDLKTRVSSDNRAQLGKLGFSITRSERNYVDNMNGLDGLKLDFSGDNWNLAAGYQHYLTDGVSRFTGLANPIMSLASNAMTTDAEYKSGHWTFGARAYIGEITDEGLLENDPTVSAQFNPARLGLVHGGHSHVAWSDNRLYLQASVGNMIESGTVLGAVSGGLLNIGAGNTTYVDTVARFMPMDNVALTARSTFARTSTDASGAFILGMSELYSNAFAFGADIGNFSFSVSQPLAVSNGKMQYAYADYDVIEDDTGKYDLMINDAHVSCVDLSPEKRELRFMASLRHQFGSFTDGALGLIYRINPNNTDAFGNESVVMLKFNHRLGI